MKTEILKIADQLRDDIVTTDQAKLLLLNLLNDSNNNTCDNIFEHASSVDTDYEFNLHNHWKEGYNADNFDSKPIGGFSDY